MHSLFKAFKVRSWSNRRRRRNRFRKSRTRFENLEPRVVLAPVVNFGFFAISEGEPEGTILTGNVSPGNLSGQINVTDVVGTPSYSISSGNTDVDGDGSPPFRLENIAREGDEHATFLAVNDAGDLDFETQQNFILVVQVTDEEGSGSEFQIVTVADVPENTSPEFEDNGPFDLPENSPNDTVVGTVTAHDAEGHTLAFSIIDNFDGPDDDGAEGPDGEIGAFGIVASNAVGSADIFVLDTDDINFEALPEAASPEDPRPITIVVRATDDGQNEFFTDTTVTIFIEDRNDAPDAAGQSFTIPENSGNGTSVGTVVASDQDGDDLTYVLIPNPANDSNNNSVPPIGIDGTTGDLFVTDHDDLNFELDPEFDFTVTITDDHADPGAEEGDDPIPNPLTTVITVSINLLDVIENIAPVILPDQTFSVSEDFDNGAVPVRESEGPDDGVVLATDADEPAQGLSFAILAGNVDINDNGTPAFAVDEASGQLTVLDTGDLDHEQTPELDPADPPRFELTIRVTDDGEDNLFDEGIVTVLVLDVNDEPVFEDQERAVAENAPFGSLVGDPLNASDLNGDTLTFEILTQSVPNAFAIDASSGQLTVEDSLGLDFEALLPNGIITVEVEVTDDGVPAKSDTAEVTVFLSNVIENLAPEFDDDAYTFPVGQGATLAENSPAGTLVGTVEASDPVLAGQLPADQTLSYSVEAGNVGDAFAINEFGEIVVETPGAVDFETTPIFTLTVRATDDGEGPLFDEATVTVNLREANDVPTIDPDQVGTLLENTASGDPASAVPFGGPLFVTGDDQDGDTFEFEIVGQWATGVDEDGDPIGTPIDVGPVPDESTGAFSIDATSGQLFGADPTKHDFDGLLEALYGPSGLDILPLGMDNEDLLPTILIEVEVTATDSVGQTGPAEIVRVAVINQDDNTAPVGQDQGGFTFDIAADPDGDGEHIPLSDNEATGDCTVQLSPDHLSVVLIGCGTDSTEDGTASIVAGDPGTGDVLVSDINVVEGDIPIFVWTPFTTIPNPLAGEEDEPPTLPAPFDDTARQELLAGGLHLVYDLPAGGIGGTIGLGQEANTDAFVIDENADGVNNLTGATRDAETNDVVSDGDPIGVLPDSASGTPFSVDDAEGYDVKYEIVSGNSDSDGDGQPAFYIDAAGVLRVNDTDELDADTMPQHNLVVRVTDCPIVPDYPAGHPSEGVSESSQSSTFTVEVNLRDRNDAPIFVGDIQFGSVLENTPFPGLTVVGEPIEAFDGDGDELTFSILTPDTPFAADPATGQITVDDEVDFESHASWSLDVKVVDPDGLFDTGPFIILVLNVDENLPPDAPDNINDFDPFFGGREFDLELHPDIDEDDDPGSSGTCSATLSPLQTLVGGSEHAAFNLNCTHNVANPTAAHILLEDDSLIEFDIPVSPLILDLDPDSSFEDPFLIEGFTFDDFEQALLDNLLMIEVESTDFPDGELRADLPAPSMDQLFVMEGTDSADAAIVGDSFFLGASDPDPDNISLTYAIVGGNIDLDGDGEPPYGIDEVTGEFFVVDSDDIDYETNKNHFLTIGVTDEPPLDASLTSTGLQQIAVSDKNDAPSIAPIFNLFSPLDMLTLKILGVDTDKAQEFADSDFLHDPVLDIVAEGVTPPPVDPQFIINLELFVDQQLFFDFFGEMEKWLRASPVGPGGEIAWYFILPSGEMFEWDGSNAAAGTSIGFVGIDAYIDPIGEIVEAETPDDIPLPAATLLEIDPAGTGFLNAEVPSEFTITRLSGEGTAIVTVKVCDALDGGLCDTESFEVIYGENIVPVLAPIGDQTTTEDNIVIPLLATDTQDAEFDFSFNLSSPEFFLNELAGGIGLDFRLDGSDFRNVFGADERWVRNSNAITGLELPGGGTIDIAGNQWFFVKPDNTITLWDNTSAASGTLIAQLNPGAHTDLLNVITPADAPNATAELVDNVLTLTKNPGFNGVVVVEIEVTDGADEDREILRAFFN